MKYLTVWNIAIVAIVIAGVGFLSMHEYYSQLGFISSLMAGKIYFTADCIESSYGEDCISISYKWILALDIIGVAVALMIRPRISN